MIFKVFFQLVMFYLNVICNLINIHCFDRSCIFNRLFKRWYLCISDLNHQPGQPFRRSNNCITVVISCIQSSIKMSLIRAIQFSALKKSFCVALKRAFVELVVNSSTVYLELVYLVTALVPSDTACLASSPGSRRRTAVWISLE
ncbi:hypothetical protein ATANTOWER_031021, partial [Ataeniobius toweri]|nr:hypothetical protein [Ataeniobius toweri]